MDNGYPEKYMTNERLLPDSSQENIYNYDKDYIFDHWDRPDI